jgi:hypothetical protein
MIGGLCWHRHGASKQTLKAIWLFCSCLAATIGNPESSCLPHRQSCYSDATGAQDFSHGTRNMAVSVRNEARTKNSQISATRARNAQVQWQRQRREGHLMSSHACAFSFLSMEASALSPVCLMRGRDGLCSFPLRGMAASNTGNTRCNLASPRCARPKPWSVNLHMKRSNKADFAATSTAVSDDKDQDQEMVPEEMVLKPKPVRREIQELAPSAIANDLAGLPASASASGNSSTIKSMIKSSNFRQARSFTVKVRRQVQGQASSSCSEGTQIRKNAWHAQKMDALPLPLETSSQNTSSMSSRADLDVSLNSIFLQ